MARVDKAETNIQVFRGSLPKMDVFAANAGDGCCPSGLQQSYDKLGERTRFDNALAHSNPIGANDKYFFPTGAGFDADKADIITHINEHGVGATVSVLAIPTYAFVTGVGIHVAGEEDGLTFNLITRNGLALPSDAVYMVEAAVDENNDCAMTRTLVDLDGEESIDPFEGFGELNDNLFVDIFARSCCGEFSLEADELILEVASMPAGGIVNGDFAIEVAVSYQVIHRAER